MPTAARLTAAIVFGALGFYFASMSTAYFAEAKQPSYWFPLCAVIGILCGWIIAGKRAGLGWSAGIGNGITVVIAMIFWIFFLMSFADMIQKSMRRSYDGPMEAVVNVFEIMGEYAVDFAAVELGVLLAVGAVVGGLIVEFVTKRAA